MIWTHVYPKLAFCQFQYISCYQWLASVLNSSTCWQARESLLLWLPAQGSILNQQWFVLLASYRLQLYGMSRRFFVLLGSGTPDLSSAFETEVVGQVIWMTRFSSCYLIRMCNYLNWSMLVKLSCLCMILNQNALLYTSTNTSTCLYY